MDKKSFFRGFGVGVLFASTILGISFMIRTSDSFVKSRARELGMVYAEQGGSDKVISDTSEDSSEQKEDSNKTEESTADSKAETKEVADNQAQETGADSKDSKENNTQTKETSTDQKQIDMEKEKEKLEKDLNGERAKLIINAGEWSSDVSKKLEKMKIIDSAKDFDEYLEKNGYGNSITAGTYTVSPDDTYKQIAQKITGKSK